MKPDRAHVIVQGLIAGLIGYATVVLFFMIVNAVQGRSPFYTAAVLGSYLFYGLDEPLRLVIEPGPVIAYNGVHLILFLIIGQVAAWLVFETERHHSLWYFIFFLFLAGFIYGLTVVGVVGAEIAHVLSWWSVVGANIAWVLAVGVYLWLTHRGLVRNLRTEQETEF